MRLKSQCFEADFVPNTAAGQLRILTGFPRANPKGWRRATRLFTFVSCCCQGPVRNMLVRLAFSGGSFIQDEYAAEGNSLME